ncbi:MAG TPA: cyanophycin synthetase [Methylibium sp.]|uniref:cyanophycin synthetase n=1 Tax=Methylibium sp. TaxID=2067992 RepID=UPI002DBB93EF|nr:cyanophycin synthetase [Methylibium sp.]HEU4458080.1 cyanophycin synthetase [Methylibium sp.]
MTHEAQATPAQAQAQALASELRLLRIRYLRGPNVWTYRPVLETWLDLGELEDHPSHQLPGFNDRLRALLPALEEHHCGVGERGGFLQRLREGTWCGHVLEHVVIELLNLAGMPTGFGQTRSTSKRGVYRMVFRARDEQVARVALAQGHALMQAAIAGAPFAVDSAVDAVREQVDRSYFGPSTAAIVGAATDRRIPHIRLNDGNLVQLGHGAQQRRIWTAETDRTSAIAEGIASDKNLTKSLLASCGVPIPEGRIVGSREEAWEAAEDLGLPVVVKPTDGNHGRGVTLDLNKREDIEAAYALAAEHGSEVMVERCIRGLEHRLLVVGGRVVAAARGEAAYVAGDGRSTVLELIASQINTDPRRGDSEQSPLGFVDPFEDGAVMLEIQRQGLQPDAVPAAGRRVLIQRNGNVAVDCTDAIHPEVDHVVALAARVVGLDIAGVDVVAEDIARPLAEQGAAVVEVNAGPGLLMHLRPAEGMPRPVGHAIVDHLFDAEQNGRIPIVGVAGSRDANTVARLVARLAHLTGRHVGLACRDGLFLGARRVEREDSAHWDAGHRLLINRNVEVAVFENGAEAILRDGLAYDRCDVGVVTDLEHAEALAEFDVHASDQLVKVMRTQVDVVLADGVAVLNADDERIAALAELSDGEVILYAQSDAVPALKAHRERGGRAVFVRDARIVLASDDGDAPGLQLGQGRAAKLAVEALLAAVAAAWGLGIAPELIAAGVETFEQ